MGLFNIKIQKLRNHKDNQLVHIDRLIKAEIRKLYPEL